MLTNDVRQYLDQCLQQGMTFDAVREDLLGNGWIQADVEQVLNEYQAAIAPNTSSKPGMLPKHFKGTPTHDVSLTELNGQENFVTNAATNRRGVVIGLMTLVVFLFICGVASAYIMFWSNP